MLIPVLALYVVCSIDLHVDEAHGFQIEIPAGWTSQEQEQAGTGFALSVRPPGSIGHEGVRITVLEAGAGESIESLLEVTRATIKSKGDDYSRYEEWEDEVDGKAAVAIRVDYRAPSAEYRILQTYVVGDGGNYLLQRHARVEEFEEVIDALEAVIDSFAFVEVGGDAAAERELQLIARRCGSEVAWAQSWEEAAARARGEKRLVLVVAYLIPGFDITDTPRTTTFMDPDVIELVN
jgi:hypothetical protein